MGCLLTKMLPRVVTSMGDFQMLFPSAWIEMEKRAESMKATPYPGYLLERSGRLGCAHM